MRASQRLGPGMQSGLEVAWDKKQCAAPSGWLSKFRSLHLAPCRSYIKDLRALQTLIDKTIVAVQVGAARRAACCCMRLGAACHRRGAPIARRASHAGQLW